MADGVYLSRSFVAIPMMRCWVGGTRTVPARPRTNLALVITGTKQSNSGEFLRGAGGVMVGSGFRRDA